MPVAALLAFSALFGLALALTLMLVHLKNFKTKLDLLP